MLPVGLVWILVTTLLVMAIVAARERRVALVVEATAMAAMILAMLLMPH